jgi:hypothetical protein
VQESDKAHDFSEVHLRRWKGLRSRRRCGNVGTRVVCGFPSAGEEVGNSHWGVATDPPGRSHFHSEAEDSAHFRQKQPSITAQKPRSMRIYPDSRAEPKIARAAACWFRAARDAGRCEKRHIPLNTVAAAAFERLALQANGNRFVFLNMGGEAALRANRCWFEDAVVEARPRPAPPCCVGQSDGLSAHGP